MPRHRVARLAWRLAHRTSPWPCWPCWPSPVLLPGRPRARPGRQEGSQERVQWGQLSLRLVKRLRAVSGGKRGASAPLATHMAPPANCGGCRSLTRTLWTATQTTSMWGGPASSGGAQHTPDSQLTSAPPAPASCSSPPSFACPQPRAPTLICKHWHGAPELPHITAAAPQPARAPPARRSSAPSIPATARERGCQRPARACTRRLTATPWPALAPSRGPAAAHPGSPRARTTTWIRRSSRRTTSGCGEQLLLQAPPLHLASLRSCPRGAPACPWRLGQGARAPGARAQPRRRRALAAVPSDATPPAPAPAGLPPQQPQLSNRSFLGAHLAPPLPLPPSACLLQVHEGEPRRPARPGLPCRLLPCRGGAFGGVRQRRRRDLGLARRLRRSAARQPPHACMRGRGSSQPLPGGGEMVADAADSLTRSGAASP